MDFAQDQELFIKYAETRNPAIKNQIALKNQKLVSFVVNRFYNKKREHKDLREDLLQEGKIGLLSAIDGFKPELGFQFSTYGTWWIRQAINNFLLGQTPLIKIPTNVRTAQNKVLKKIKEENMLLSDLIDGNAATLNVTEKMLKSINAALKTKTVSSIDEPTSNTLGKARKDYSTLGDSLSNPNDITADNKTDHQTLLEAVKASLNKIPERERYILLLRYNVINEEEILNLKSCRGSKGEDNKNA